MGDEESKVDLIEFMVTLLVKYVFLMIFLYIKCLFQDFGFQNNLIIY